MKTIQAKLIITGFVLAMVSGNLYSQGLQASLFDEVNQSMWIAKQAQADVLSPGTFDDAMDEYKAAKKKYNDDGDLSDIKKGITKSNNKFQEATENSKVSAVMFSSALSARRDAISAEADGFEKDMWVSAENKMREAAEKLEKGDAGKAKEKATEATALYRKAELESIKANYLTSAKNLLKKADNDKVYKVAPKTIAEAKNLVSQAEKELLENRYDTDEARFLAKQAEYKALLAIHIAKEEKKFDEKDFKTEDYLLMSYAPIAKIGESLNMNMKFANGVDLPVTQIIEQINSDKLHATNLQSMLYSQKMTNGSQKAMLAEQQFIIESMKGQLSDDALKGKKRQAALQNRLDELVEINNKFEQVQQIFNQEEAQVFRQKNDVIIRLIGVNFAVGKAQINQEDYPLLTKAQKAMKLFTDASIVIEGHTDSQGGDDQNLALSQERAKAVLSYLTANTTLDKSRFSTVGYGESRPVANNETLEGRKLNRHIDIVIRPTFTEALLSSVDVNLIQNQK